MKAKLFFLILTILASFPLLAQTEKGNFMVGGSPGIGLNKYGQRLDLSPQAGYFIKDNLAIGLKSSFSLYRAKDVSNIFAEREWALGARTESVSLFSRYYFPTQSKWRPFLQGELGYGGQDYFHGRLDGGVVYFVNDKFSVDISAGLGVLTDGWKFQGAGFQGPSIGFNFFFGGKKK